MIDMSLSTPIQDVSVYQFPLDLVSQILQEVSLFVFSFIIIKIIIAACGALGVRIDLICVSGLTSCKGTKPAITFMFVLCFVSFAFIVARLFLLH